MANALMLAALEYQALGFSVIPLKPKGKMPIIPSWAPFQGEIAPRELIGEWWRTWPDANIGIVTGEISGLLVIDCDSRDAASEIKSSLGDMTAVGIVSTGKGFHLYYAHNQQKFPSKIGIREHLDFKGDGGYVVAPPSIHESGKKYEWIKPLNGKLRTLPDDFIALLNADKQQGTRVRFDTAKAISGMPHGQRDDGMFKLACKLRGADVPYEIALQLCEQAGANCDPPFLQAKQKVDQAFKYPVKEKSSQEPKLWPEIKTASDLLNEDQDDTNWLLQDCLPMGACSMLVAKAKVGKSTVSIALSLAVSRGIPFLGREVKRGAVLYIFLDGPARDIKEQFRKAGVTANDLIFWHAGAIPAKAIAWASEMIDKTKAVLVVVDTIQKFFKFENINDYSEVANTMDPMLRAAQQANCHVMFLHHAGKFALDDMDSAIGSSVLKGQGYANLHLKKLPESEIRILKSEQRGGRNFEEIALGFENPDGSGLLKITGTRAQAEIQSVEPSVREALKDSPLTETELRETIGARGLLVSLAIRSMLKRGELETTGVKRSRTDPLKYHLAANLLSGKQDSSV